MSKHGLTPDQMEQIAAVLHPYADKIETVGLFGSRAQGTYRPNSDVDLVIRGNLDEADVDRLYTLFEESSLPFQFDVIAYHRIAYPPLKRHIDQVFCPILSHDDLAKGRRERSTAG
ncbi:MAG: nucleotidyltransferase domain-containing protein [Myxococcales bacterium]|nr:nucleotidyltransferase domain-containing protein [Myxococcales bacterium]